MLNLAVVALLSAGALGDNQVGINTHDGRPSFVAAADQLGVTWVRFDANWFVLEPAQDAYQWATLDAQVDAAHAAGLKVFLTLAYTPAWVPRHGDSDGQPRNDVPNTSAEWVDFVRDAVSHYRARGVQHFGLWNEANLQSFFEGTVDEYANILVNPGAAAVRAVCADCYVLGPDLAHVGDVDDYLEQTLARTAGAWDIITHHTYNGFRETGWRIWDGDGFLNALELQRFSFTRRGLRQVLDAAGWTGEVWITETGYRTRPPGDATEEGLQAIYVRRVLEEQLQRAWWTNSFFYEIHDCGPDQPGCPIDGFGIMRATSGTPGQRSFPNDFRLKPAFTEIQSFIQNNPAIIGTQPALQCGDGIDNDSDGRIDLQDRGCSGPTDDDESDDPPRERLVAVPLTAPSVDGDHREWSQASWTTLSDWQGTEPLGAGDLEVRIAVGWTSDAIWIAFEVVDDVNHNPHPVEQLWMGDGVQLAFDIAQSGGRSYDSVDDHEFSIARGAADGAARVYREHGPAGLMGTPETASQSQGSTVRYEVRIPASELPSLSLTTGEVFGFSCLVNDADGAQRIGWMQWTSGIGLNKEPEAFGEIELGSPPSPMDAGVVDAAADAGLDAGPDAASSMDAGVAADAEIPSDAGRPDVGGTGTERDSGVADASNPAPAEGCRNMSLTDEPSLWLLGAFLLIGMRRRRAV